MAFPVKPFWPDFIGSRILCPNLLSCLPQFVLVLPLGPTLETTTDEHENADDCTG